MRVRRHPARAWPPSRGRRPLPILGEFLQSQGSLSHVREIAIPASRRTLDQNRIRHSGLSGPARHRWIWLTSPPRLRDNDRCRPPGRRRLVSSDAHDRSCFDERRRRPNGRQIGYGVRRCLFRRSPRDPDSCWTARIDRHQGSAGPYVVRPCRRGFRKDGPAAPLRRRRRVNARVRDHDPRADRI